MHVAFILITAEKGRAWAVAAEVAKVEGVKFAYSVTGPYDVIAYVETEEPVVKAIKGMIEKIHAIDGVCRTLTCIAVH